VCSLSFRLPLLTPRDSNALPIPARQLALVVPSPSRPFFPFLSFPFSLAARSGAPFSFLSFLPLGKHSPAQRMAPRGVCWSWLAVLDGPSLAVAVAGTLARTHAACGPGLSWPG